MAKAIQAWESNDGALHHTECAAAKRDLQLVIADSPCAENSPYARTMLDWMTGNAGEIAAALAAYHAACPAPTNSIESSAPTGTPGPILSEGTRELADETHGDMA